MNLMGITSFFFLLLSPVHSHSSHRYIEYEDNQDSSHVYTGVGNYSSPEHENAFIQGGIDMLLELLTLTWSRISSDVKRELDTEQKLLSLLREHNINSLDHHANAVEGDRYGLGPGIL